MMEAVSIFVTDPESKETFKFLVSQEDRDRALVDDEFLNSLLRLAKKTNTVESAEYPAEEDTESSLLSPDNNEDELLEDEGAGTSCNVQKKVWGENETLLLISCVETRYDELNHPQKRKSVWKNIAQDMLTNGYDVPATICTQKWKNLLRTYKVCKDKNKQTGTGPTRFSFYQRMDEFLNNKPNIKSPHMIDTLISTEVNVNGDISQNSDVYVDMSEENNNKEKPSIEQLLRCNEKKKTPSKRKNAKTEYYRKKSLALELKAREQEENDRYREKRLMLEERKIKALEDLVAIRQNKYTKND